MLTLEPNSLYTLSDLCQIFSARTIATLRSSGRLRSVGRSAEGAALYLGQNLLAALLAISENRHCQRGLSGKEESVETSDPKKNMESSGRLERRTRVVQKQPQGGIIQSALVGIERQLQEISVSRNQRRRGNPSGS